MLLTRVTQADAYATLYLGRNYVFSGLAPASFAPLATITGFAMYGALSADFLASAAYEVPANALPVEGRNPNPFPLVAGMGIQLEGVDIVLPDVCDFDALANSVLLFAGNEIMSVAEATMTASGAYTLTVIRGRFGTVIADHHNGDTVWIIPLASLKAIAHPHFQVGNVAQFKLTIGSQNISDVNPFTFGFGALLDVSGQQILDVNGNPIIPLNP